MNLPIPNRRAAGRTLGNFLEQYASRRDLQVLALSPEAVPVAFEIAQALDAPLDLFLVRRLHLVGKESLDIGAVVSGGEPVLNEDLLYSMQIRHARLKGLIQRQRQALLQREQYLRGSRPSMPLAGRWVLLVDDVLATGVSVRAAVWALRRQQAARILVAVPVASTRALEQVQALTDEVAFIATQEPFQGADWWYEDHGPVSDAEVQALLERAFAAARATADGAGRKKRDAALKS